MCPVNFYELKDGQLKRRNFAWPLIPAAMFVSLGLCFISLSIYLIKLERCAGISKNPMLGEFYDKERGYRPFRKGAV